MWISGNGNPEVREKGLSDTAWARSSRCFERVLFGGGSAAGRSWSVVS